MATRMLSVRIKAETLEQLAARAQETGEPKSRLAQRLIEEGLRLERHAGIMFREGPTGRRAAVVGGPDVWEIASVIDEVAKRGESVVETVAELTGLMPSQIQAAIRYYAEFPDEIHLRVRRNQELAERLEAQNQREQRLLQQ